MTLNAIHLVFGSKHANISKACLKNDKFPKNKQEVILGSIPFPCKFLKEIPIPGSIPAKT